MRSKSWLWAIVVVMALVLAATVGPVLAHDPEDEGAAADHDEMMGGGMMHGGIPHGGIPHGGMVGGSHMGLGDPVTLERVAGVLGLEYEDMVSRMDAGQTIGEIADAQGVDETLVVQAILAPHEEMLQVMVKNGYIDGDEAEAIYERAQQWVEQAISTQGGQFTEMPCEAAGDGSVSGWGTGRGSMMGGGTMGGGMMGGGRMGGGRTGGAMMGTW